MKPAQSGVKLTYDDFVLFPDDGQRHEYLRGLTDRPTRLLWPTRHP